MKKKKTALSVECLETALQSLKKTKSLSVQTMFVPFLILALVFAGFFHFKPEWYKDVIVDCILFLFVFGQLIAIRQFFSINRGAKNGLKVINILDKNGNRPNLDDLKAHLLEYAPFGYVRDMLLRWINMGLKGETKENRVILNNAAERRLFADQKSLGIHILLNRITLKLGFIGTLWGLLRTFGPMKDAIQSLKEFNGEMAFVKDIVEALKGDEYAIYSTLIATGLSLIIELLIIQIISRLQGGFVVSDSCLNDWNSIVLLPAVEKQKNHAILPEALMEIQESIEKKIAQSQNSIQSAMESFLATADSADRQVQLLKELHERFATSVRDIREFEQKRYVGQLEEMEHQISDRIHEIREYDRFKKQAKRPSFSKDTPQ